MGVKSQSKAQKFLKMCDKSPYGLLVKAKALQLLTSGAVQYREGWCNPPPLMRPLEAQLDWNRTGPATNDTLHRTHSHPVNSVTHTYRPQWRSHTSTRGHKNSILLSAAILSDCINSESSCWGIYFLFYITFNVLNISLFMCVCISVCQMWRIETVLNYYHLLVNHTAQGKKMLSLHCFLSVWPVQIKAQTCVSLHFVFIEHTLKQLHAGCSCARVILMEKTWVNYLLLCP